MTLEEPARGITGDDRRMLSRLGAEPYVVGADLPDAIEHEVWPLVLPERPRHVVCVCADARTIATASSYAERCEALDDGAGLTTERDRADVAVVARLPHGWTGDAARVAGELVRLVRPGGALLVPGAVAPELLAAGWHEHDRFWCAPTWRAPVALARTSDLRAVAYLLDHGLADPATTVPMASRVAGGALHDELVLLRRAPAVPTVGVPAWLAPLAAAGHVDLGQACWALWARRRYASQKVVVFLLDASSEVTRPAAVVKVAREPTFNRRIVVDSAAMRRVRALEHLREHVPAPIREGEHAGRRTAAATAVDGTALPLLVRAAAERHERAVVALITALGSATARTAPASVAARAHRRLVDRFAELYEPGDDERRFLHAQVDALGDVGTLPLVMQHGNVADWNVVVGDDGRIVLLDWEFAEEEGLPLWDLFFFLRVQRWPLVTGWRRRLVGRWRPRRDVFLRPGDRTLADAVAAYRAVVPVPSAAVVPIFHLCWVDHCLNAATHVTRDGLGRAPMRQLLLRSIALDRSGRLAAHLGVVVTAGRTDHGH